MNWADWLGLAVLAFFLLGAVGHLVEAFKEGPFAEKAGQSVGAAVFGIVAWWIIITLWGAEAAQREKVYDEWVGKAETVGELIGIEYYGALYNRTVTDCRAYEWQERRYIHCLPAPYDRFLKEKVLDILIEWKDGAAYPANGTTHAAMRRFRRVQLGLPDTQEEMQILEAKAVVRFLRDGGPQPMYVLEAIRSGNAKRVY